MKEIDSATLTRYVRATRILITGFICLAVSCRNATQDVSTDSRLREFLAADAARPFLLDDHKELLVYLKSFPRDRYNLCPTKNGFSFFVEKEERLDGIKQVVSKGQVWEEDFIELMAESIKPGSAVIDAGAYIGTHTLAMAKLVGRQGRVFAFEPQKKVFRELIFNLIENRISNVIPLRFALGGDVRIVEMDRPINGIEATVGIGTGGDRVELRTLDSFNIPGVSFIKIDVEGFEDAVLDGARRTIAANRNPPILIEIARAADYASAPPDVRTRIEGTLNKLEDYGYAVTPLKHRDYLALPAPAYALGSVLSFTDSGNAGRFKSRWWSTAAPWGSWALGYEADIVLAVAPVPKKDLVLTGMAKALVNEKNPRQEIEIIINGWLIDRWIFRNGKIQQKGAVIPVRLLRKSDEKCLLHIAFRVKKPKSPAELGLAADKRLLGLGVQELIVREL